MPGLREPRVAWTDAARASHPPTRRGGNSALQRFALKTLVVGVGSDIRADDGVGLHVVRYLKRRISYRHADLVEVGTAGLGLLDLVPGYDLLIIVDASVTGAPPGTVHEFRGHDLSKATHLGPGHDADVVTVLALGDRLPGVRMPKDVVVVAVEAEDVTTISERLTPDVEAAVAVAAARVENVMRTTGAGSLHRRLREPETPRAD